MPAVAIADGSITSPFLALFGRSARATGMENERNNKSTPAQWLYLLNSTEVQRKLEQGTNLQAVISFGSRKSSDVVEDLYLTILSRFPTAAEVEVIDGYGKVQPGRAGRYAAANTAAPKSANSTNATAPTTGTNQVAKGYPLGSLGPAPKPADKPVVVKRREDWLDVAWSLINSEEFLYRH
jgi:hypothetical protein